MTSNVRPFLARQAMRLPEVPGIEARYNRQRDINEVNIGNRWVPAADEGPILQGHTRHTDVKHETTDDD